ncbi:phosphoribosylanthranilate isomerase [Saccharibacter floricola]|uniref:phosphoribosylanthranilate isomerase n=1 Tax=Saccharibacter floricola TaxID=231053 RepID=UPI00037A4C8E|nr:phosphoribosylanthranilate isomerase [Saccharibacter floricola]
MSDVKICGITRTEDIQLCAQLGVKWVGFVFYPPSPRSLSAQHAQCLHESVPSPSEGGPLRVGLFVRPTFDEIAHILNVVPLDILQLYTSVEEALSFRKHFNLPVWQAHGIRHKSDLPTSSDNLPDGFIIEAPADKNDTRPGGLGKRFDWALTQEWRSPLPWLLAGGLTPDNVREAIATSNAPAVDVSSGVESAPGQKSALLLEKFIEIAHNRGCTLK